MAARLVYKKNDKHKRGAQGEGPPRWFPDADSLCPDELTVDMAQALLDHSIPGNDSAHPDKRARFAIHQGDFYKAYRTEVSQDTEIWHGYPVRTELVRTQVPARVLREFVKRGQLDRPTYKRLLGSAR